MARLPRLTLADLAYHVTQRGNRRQAVFFTEADRHVYRKSGGVTDGARLRTPNAS